MSAAAQTARMVLRAPEAKSPVAIRMPAPALRAAQAARAVPVSRTSDPAEREADRVSRRVIAMPAAAVAPQARRFGSAVPAVSNVPAALGVGTSTGLPLPRSVRRDMEPRFQAGFSNVRLHTGEAAARASRRLNAAAFTAGRDVFFGRGSFQPDAPAGRQLIAHELTHTIQQGAARQGPVQRSADTRVSQQAAPQTVHRLGVQDALDFFAEKAAWIPGFSMLALLLGFNPVSLRAVPRTAANLLRAMIQLIPGGPLITQALDSHGIVDKVAAWAEGQLSALGDIGSAIRQSIDEFLDGLSWTDIFDLDGVWARAKRIVTGPIDAIIRFGSGLVSGIITFIKDAILRPIAALIEPTRGYPLLKAVLGFDPVTGDAVPRTPASLLGGFMTLIGQEEVWRNIQQGNAVGQAYAWFTGALSGLMGIVTAIPGTFLAAFQSLQLVDIIIVPRAFARIIGVFGSIAGQFLSWGLGTVIKLLEIIFSVVAPGAMGYLRRAGGALQSIFRNPIGFVMNLVRAAKAGFQRFGSNLLQHLQAGLISWLTGSLPGIYVPRGLDLPEILKFGMSVLGISWANLRTKLVRAVGEPAVRAMEMGFDLVVTLVRDGPAAAWAQMQEQLANLRQMAIDGITDMVVNLVTTRAVPRLIAMFIPGAGFITAIMSIYGTVTTFIAQLSRIAQVITSFLDSMMAIAGGNITAAAARVESTLAGLLTLAINFLAGFAGLGRVADRVRAVIERIRAPIDRALDRVVAWIVAQARRLGRLLVSGVRRAIAPSQATAAIGPDTRSPDEKRAAVHAAITEAMAVARRRGVSREAVDRALPEIARRHRLHRLQTVDHGEFSYRIHGELNPVADSDDLPKTLTVQRAVVEVRRMLSARSTQFAISVASLEDAQTVIAQALPAAAQVPSPTAGSAYLSQTDLANIEAFRALRRTALVYHVDIQRYRVGEIRMRLLQETRDVTAQRDRARTEMQYHRDNPAWSLRHQDNLRQIERNLTDFGARLRNLQEIEANRAVHEADWMRLEREGVLLGHATVNADESHHRTNPHVNVEGRTNVTTRTETFDLFIKLVIYVRN